VNVLGISAFYHDASAAVIANGRLIAAASEERYTRQKHDPNFPKFAIEHCLERAGLTSQNLDAVIFYEEPHTKFTRVLGSVLSAYPRTSVSFIRSMKDWMRSKLWLKSELSRRLGVPPSRIEFCAHHLSHAYQAFVGSPFDEAAVLTVDAVGEWASTGLFHARKGAAIEMRLLETVPYPHSLGLLYSIFTAFLGFRPNDGESSVMALASFGQPRYEAKIRKVLRIQSDGGYEIDQSYLDHFAKVPYTRKFVALFGEPRNFKEKLPFNTLGENSAPIPPDDQRYADIAASLQRVLEEALLALARRLRRMTGVDSLCFAGGVALNCVANSALVRESGFSSLYIPPDPGDGGAAIGAAAYGAFREKGVPEFRMTPYLGSSYDEDADIAMLSRVDTGAWGEYRRPGASPLTATRVEASRPEDFEDLVAEAVTDLKAGKIVGWFQERFENGPRALGNRSILADPSRVDVALRLSRCVKSRARFRPYAFSVASEDARRCLNLPATGLPAPARWMQMVLDVKSDATEAVQAAIHVDRTNRAQVCAREDNPRFHRLLSVFGEASGWSALLNTSFNESGFPIVATPAEAMLMFARTDIDTLVLNNSIVRKISA
jgi:carbamoyltransferase